MKNAEQSSAAPSVQIYQLLVELQYIDPPIWRRIQVRDDTTLGTLHEILQFVMGWEDGHMHQFVHNDTSYGMLDEEMSMDLDVNNEDEFTLRDLGLRVGDSLSYEYDFGDGWLHELVLEEKLPPAPATRYPACLEGERACPPEDCGGPPGYENILRILALSPKKRSEDDIDMIDWLGDDYDPEEFDIDIVNQELIQFAPSRTGWSR
jgi:hypothetical protein